MTAPNKPSNLSAPHGIDTKLIVCLEAFEKWMESQLWLYEYDSAKAAWMGAWFAHDAELEALRKALAYVESVDESATPIKFHAVYRKLVEAVNGNGD